MKQLLLYCLLILLAMGCKQKYESPVHSPVTGYLVVDGVVNSAGAASLTLSRTAKLDSTTMVYETGAAVTVQGQDSSVYVFSEKGQGIYSADNLTLNSSLKYRLRITVAGGENFLSDFVVVKNNPPIDTISWRFENNGLQTYINTHDPQNNTRYYQWVYDETWEIHSAYLSFLKYQITDTPNGPYFTAVYRDSTFSYDPDIVTCWQYNTPTNIFLGSTAKLSSDIVYLPLTFIPHASVELSVLYSVHLKQYTWTADGYSFLEKMKKNTESTGSVFDAQPSELNSNIHSTTNASEPVIGFFNICPVREKRIFIKTADVPGWGYNDGCFSVLIPNISDSIKIHGVDMIPTTVESQAGFGHITLFDAAPPGCVDCTLRGSNKKPAYWP
jgi:Domain of unknown function (DUF4249)